MQLNKLIQTYAKKFSDAGISEGQKEIRYLVEESINISMIEQLYGDIILKELQKKKVINLLNRRLKREPIERIINKKVFRDVNLILKKKTFSPRKETELIIDLIIKENIKPKKVLELGTGSGAIIISLMKYFKNSFAIATDIDINNLYLAKKNALINGVESQINFICCNWADIFVNSDFDLILANPPYIKTEVIEKLEPEVKFYDPIIALDGGKDGLEAYKQILLGLSRKVKDGSVIIFEIGFDQESEVSNLMKKANIMNIKLIKDYSNNARFLMGKIHSNLYRK